MKVKVSKGNQRLVLCGAGVLVFFFVFSFHGFHSIPSNVDEFRVKKKQQATIMLLPLPDPTTTAVTTTTAVSVPRETSEPPPKPSSLPDVAAIAAAVLQGTTKTDTVCQPKTNLDASRRNEVVAALKHAWSGYRRYGWPNDEFAPLNQTGSNWPFQPKGGGFPVGLMMIDSLDTLLMAGMSAEADEVIHWIEFNLDFDVDVRMNVFESIIRILGGLLSAYELSGGRKILLTKAVELADRLMPAYSTPTGLPDNWVNLRTGVHEGDVNVGRSAVLSEFGTHQMEFRKLSALTGNRTYDEKATAALLKIKPLCKGFCPMLYDYKFKPSEWPAGLGAYGDSFYEYLLKLWLLTGKKEDIYREWWMEAANHVLTTSVRSVDGFVVPNGNQSHYRMEHLACFSGGLFALSYYHTQIPSHLQMAKDIGDTCHHMYDATKSKLAADIVTFASTVEGKNRTPAEMMIGDMFLDEPKFILRPETIETYFYLWKVTGDQKYRDWGYEIFKAHEKHLKVPNGYIGTTNVQKLPVPPNDNMETFYLAESLKYFYLLFSEDELIDFDTVILTTEAHPFRRMAPYRA